jgi:hypothetical protein
MSMNQHNIQEEGTDYLLPRQGMQIQKGRFPKPDENSYPRKKPVELEHPTIKYDSPFTRTKPFSCANQLAPFETHRIKIYL